MQKFDFALPFSETEIKQKISDITTISQQLYNIETLKNIFGLLDLTTLNADDTSIKAQRMSKQVNEFQANFPDLPNVAAICVYPLLVPYVKKALKAQGVQIAAVSGGFPASQTFIDIKVLECKRCVDEGADELDVVLSVGKFLEGKQQEAFDELQAMKQATKAHVKVILETGLLKTPINMYNASMLAIQSGADFIKTSTGKTQPAATLEAAYVMCHAIAETYRTTGRKIGFKPAGGISTAQQAIDYYAIVKSILGNEWLNPHLFRIGASTLANNILSEINRLDTGIKTDIVYF